ncbi:hypothetical protein [Streptomyces sp. TRM64462]|uniref:hypothetical protein n=1 Tax=Streptomyces sp. TRM64462 TaxID=2741726 RepID=UPI001585E1DA|nr:hypothetical protein [Streptomyces sp. TRM64462]
MSAPAEERPRPLPATTAGLSWDVYAGRACVWCEELLMAPGAEPVGRIVDRLGVHDLSTTVWACARCLGRRGSGRDDRER